MLVSASRVVPLNSLGYDDAMKTREIDFMRHDRSPLCAKFYNRVERIFGSVFSHLVDAPLRFASTINLT